MENVDARFPEDAQLAGGNVRGNELADGVFGKVAGLCNAWNLEVSRIGSDVRVETRAGGGDEIDRDGPGGILLGERVDRALDAVDKCLV